MQSLDAFIGHEWDVSRPKREQTPAPAGAGMWSSKKPAPPQELQNRAEHTNLRSDPFMTKYGAAADRARVRVSVLRASDIPDRGGPMELYCTVQVPGVPKSRLNTPVDYQNGSYPVWTNFTDKQVWGWIPGKPLQFEVKNKAAKVGSGFATMVGTAEDAVIGTAVLQPEYFWPDGYSGQLQMIDQYGSHAGKLAVEIEGLGGAAARRGCCHWFVRGAQHFGESIAAIPLAIQMAFKQCFNLLRPEYPGRKMSEMMILIFGPFAVYSLVLLMLCVLRRWIETVCYAVIACLCVLFIAIFAFAVFRRKKSTGLPYSVLSPLCLLAILLGIGAGVESWDYGWQQWFWMGTGHGYGVSASSSAAASIDASEVHFDAASSVDGTRAAGFRINHDVYCAAPMLDNKTISAENPRISFWAIGINCCDDFGAYTCGASREISGGVGVVMIHRGMPCSSCNREEFRLATQKAAAQYGLISDPDALYVRYVKKKSSVSLEYAVRSFAILLFYLLLGFGIFGTLGYIANFQGWGKPPGALERTAMLKQARDVTSWERQTAIERERHERDHGCKMPRVC